MRYGTRIHTQWGFYHADEELSVVVEHVRKNEPILAKAEGGRDYVWLNAAHVLTFIAERDCG